MAHCPFVTVEEMEKRNSRIWWLCGILLLLGLFYRLPTSLSYSLHFDEPFWMLRGEWLLEQLESGSWNTLTREFWNVRRVDPDGPVYVASMGSGVPAALVTGLGQRWGGVEGSASPGRVPKARLFHALLSSLTPALLTGLAWACGMAWPGLLAFGSFLLLSPQLRTFTAIAHMESVLAITLLGSVLLFEAGRTRRRWLWIVLGGLVYGVGFATRVNAASAFLTLLVFLVLEAARQPVWRDRRWKTWGLLELLCFGSFGYLSFLILFPPIWPSPVFGFLRFLFQYGGAAGAATRFEVLGAMFPDSLIWVNQLFAALAICGLGMREVRRQRLFQLCWIFLIISLTILSQSVTLANARYLTSVVPALGGAGAVTVGSLWFRFGLESRLRAVEMAGLLTLLGLGFFSLIRERERESELSTFYSRISIQLFSEVQFWRPDFRVLHQSELSARPRLHIATPAWHVPITYLGLGMSDLRRREYWEEGWIRDNQEVDKVCRPGDWILSEYEDEIAGLIDRRQLHTLVFGQCP